MIELYVYASASRQNDERTAFRARNGCVLFTTVSESIKHILLRLDLKFSEADNHFKNKLNRALALGSICAHF